MRRFLLILICLLLLLPTVYAAENEITSLEGEITVNEDGSCDLRLTAQVSFAVPTETFVFPLNSEAKNVSAIGGDYKLRSRDDVRCAIFSAEGGFLGNHTFVCTYRLPRIVTREDAAQELALALPEKGFAYPLNSLKLTFSFPTEPENYPQWYSAYYEDVIDNYLTIQIAGKNMSVKSVAELKDQETISMTMEFPPETFDLSNLTGSFSSFDRMAFYLLAVLALFYWLFFLRGKLLLPKNQHSIAMETTPGEIPCLLFGDLPDIPALLAHWGNLGYVSIHRNRLGRILLRKEMDMGNERKAAERKLFDALFRASNTCDLQGLRFGSLCKGAGQSLRNVWTQRIFVKRSGNPRLLRGMGLLAAFFACLHVFDLWLDVGAWRWLLMPLLSLLCTLLCILVQKAVLCIFRRRRILDWLAGGAAFALLTVFSVFAGCSGLMLLNLFLQLFCGLVTMFGGRRSDVGNEQVRQLLGLRRYLKKADAQELERLCRLDGQYFYRMLPFAEELGVGEAFCKQFGHFSPDACPWLSDAKRQPKTPEEFYRLYSDVLTDIREGHVKSGLLPVKVGKR